VGGCLSAWPQETKTGPANITTFAELRDLVIDLEARETETRLRHAKRLDAFEDRLQRLRDDTRDAAAAAGEALERTKGLQVSEILRRLKNQDSRIHDLERNEPGQVLLETATDDRLLNAVTELTTVMRELVQQNTPPEVCGAPDHIGHTTCELEKGHTARHVNGISSWPRKADPGPRTCHLALYLDGEGPYRCVRESGHAGDHKDADHAHWRVGPVKS
jgi:hypothetical protein